MAGRRARRARVWGWVFGVLSLLVGLLAPVAVDAKPAVADAGFPGVSERCAVDTDLLYAELSGLIALPGFLLAAFADIWLNELGWTWVDPAHPMQTLTGIVEAKSDIAPNELPMEHDSHDHNYKVRPDPAAEWLMSDVNIDDENGLVENEWEVNDFPEWAWPNIGDRVWVNGNWILDCSHEGEDGHHAAEIHPPRAIASIRDQIHVLPATGDTPVAVKATDLYIHGNGGYVTTVLECGVSDVLLLGKILDNCTSRPGIADDYDFDIPLGPAPFPGAVAEWSVEDGPGNTRSEAPVLTYNASADVGGAYQGPAVHVHVPLAGSGALNADVFARRVYAGWVAPPPPMHHYSARLVKGHLYDDKDLDPGDCECSSFRMSVNRASEEEWYHLAGYDRPTDAGPFGCGDNTLDDWDDSGGYCDSGNLNFTGPNFDFYLGDGQDVTFHFGGYDSDCIDSTFGSPHSLEVNGFLLGLCYLAEAAVLDGPNNDPLDAADATFTTADIMDNGGSHRVGNSNYVMTVQVDELPLDFQSADLAITKAGPTSVLAGGELTYTLTATNNGPTPATDVNVTDTLPPAVHFVSATPSAGGACLAPPAGLSGTVSCTWPGDTGSGAVRNVTIMVEAPGPQTLTNAASVSSPTQDLNRSNNTASVQTEVTCTIYGTGGNDRLVGTSGDDVICGFGGNDSISGGTGDDRIFGGAGSDMLSGDAGNDVLHGEAGDDTLKGGDGDDRIFGEEGRDLLNAGGGTDFLDGGPGQDHCLDTPANSPRAAIVACEKISP